MTVDEWEVPDPSEASPSHGELRGDGFVVTTLLGLPTDAVKITFDNGVIILVRPSGYPGRIQVHTYGPPTALVSGPEVLRGAIDHRVAAEPRLFMMIGTK